VGEELKKQVKEEVKDDESSSSSDADNEAMGCFSIPENTPFILQRDGNKFKCSIMYEDCAAPVPTPCLLRIPSPSMF